jgi:putative hemolysin
VETESIVQSGTISFYPLTTEIVIGLFVLLILLLFSALISGSEVAFFSLSPSHKSVINQSKRQVHKIIRDLLKVPDKLLMTILVVNNFVKVAIVIFSTYLINRTMDFPQTTIAGFVIEIASITIILLLFGEILPKVYAGSSSLGLAQFMSRPLWFCSKLFTPIVIILTSSASFVKKGMIRQNNNLSINDISQALELTSVDEISEDKVILEGIVKFGTTSVDQIMTPRIDVVAIENDYTPARIINIINDTGYSRIPVFKDTFDNIDGILYIKDLLPHLIEIETFHWQSLLRPPYYVPENKKIDDLLKEFQKEKVHMAIVVDEYGGTSGIVTLEDILEEIVGDITDEFDDDDLLFSKVNDNTYLFDGKTQLNDFYRICNIEDDYFDEVKGEADTLAGLLLEIKSNFPKLNEKLSFQNIDFTVESLDKRRIKKIKVVFNKATR